MIASFPCAAVFWLSYEFAKYHLHSAGTFGFSMNNMLAASFAECSQALVRNPFEVIKQNMQIGAGSSMSGVIAELYQHQGFRGFYNGYFSLCFREIPFASIQYPFYEMLKLMQIKMKAKSTGRPESEVELGGVQLAVNGSVSGMFAGGLVTPFELIKTRMMTADVREERLRLVEVAKAIW